MLGDADDDLVMLSAMCGAPLMAMALPFAGIAPRIRAVRNRRRELRLLTTLFALPARAADRPD